MSSRLNRMEYVFHKDLNPFFFFWLKTFVLVFWVHLFFELLLFFIGQWLFLIVGIDNFRLRINDTDLGLRFFFKI